jgi:hypothetical protein
MSQLSSLWQLFLAIRKAFGDASPLANAVTILLPVCTWIWGFRWVLHRRLKTLKGEIHDLEKDIEHRKESLRALREQLEEAQERCSAFEVRVLESALVIAKKELDVGNEEQANRALVRWCQTEGPTLSQLMLSRAEWAISHAASEGHASGLISAEAFAIAAVSLSQEPRCCKPSK